MRTMQRSMINIISNTEMDNNPMPRPGFRPGHDPAAPQNNVTGPRKAEVVIKANQFLMHHPKHKYGVVLTTVVIDGKEKTFCGNLDKKGRIKSWWPVPTPSELAPSLFDFIRDEVLS